MLFLLQRTINLLSIRNFNEQGKNLNSVKCPFIRHDYTPLQLIYSVYGSDSGMTEIVLQPFIGITCQPVPLQGTHKSAVNQLRGWVRLTSQGRRIVFTFSQGRSVELALLHAAVYNTDCLFKSSTVSVFQLQKSSICRWVHFVLSWQLNQTNKITLQVVPQLSCNTMDYRFRTFVV